MNSFQSEVFIKNIIGKFKLTRLKDDPIKEQTRVMEVYRLRILKVKHTDQFQRQCLSNKYVTSKNSSS